MAGAHRDLERSQAVTAARAVGQACLVCNELAGAIELPGGYLVDEDLVAVFHTPHSRAPLTSATCSSTRGGTARTSPAW